MDDNDNPWDDSALVDTWNAAHAEYMVSQADGRRAHVLFLALSKALYILPDTDIVYFRVASDHHHDRRSYT